jgi:putative Mn2+ efflux pump MntP
VLRLILVAVALGLSNFAASIGIGLAGVDAKLRLRIAVVFGAFETATPILRVERWSQELSGVVLVAVGIVMATGVF